MGKRVDPCAITVLKTLKSAKIQPVASQVYATDSRGKVATAIDLLCVGACAALQLMHKQLIREPHQKTMNLFYSISNQLSSRNNFSKKRVTAPFHSKTTV